MPWKEEKNPYKIWLSEIILQQTRVQQGLSYYNKFVHSYPNIISLAAAADDEVFKLWEGLGYYSRCKNLLATARFIAAEYDGVFPSTYKDILSLKGIGPYTASAIVSFAYGLPYAVVDGNVLRVLARYFGIELAIDSTKGKIHFNNLAADLLFKKDPAAYNQAIMDFGATVCTPKLPNCNVCVLNEECIAFREGLVKHLPLKQKKPAVKKRWFYYFIFQLDGDVLIRLRQKKDIWQNLFEFYLVEVDSPKEWNEASIKKWAVDDLSISQLEVIQISSVYKQQLTHQQINGQFITLSISKASGSLDQFKKVNISSIRNFAFPRLITKYFENTHSILNVGGLTK